MTFAAMHSVFITIVFWIVHWAIVLPVVMIVVTPYILITSLFRKSRYDQAVISSYKSVFFSFAKFWYDGGFGFTP